MVTQQKLSYDNFILLNDHLSFHPGGLIATFNILSQVSNKSIEKTILDFGCGNGITIGFLKKLGYKNLVGYDRNPKAIELSKKKFSEFKFYNNIDLLIKSSTKIDLLLLESVFSFNDEADLAELIKSIQQVIRKTSINQIGIVDFYSIGDIPISLTEKMKRTFGIKKLRSKAEFEKIILSLNPNCKISSFTEHSFFLNLSDKYQVNEQVNKVMKDELLSDTFNSESEAQIFFNEYIKDMLNAYSGFAENFKYFECIVTL